MQEDSQGSENRVYGVMGWPASFLMDAEGTIYRQVVGAMTEEEPVKAAPVQT